MYCISAPAPPPAPTKKVVIPFPEESENVTRWIVDQSFRKEQERLKIPFGMKSVLLCFIVSKHRVIWGGGSKFAALETEKKMKF